MIKEGTLAPTVNFIFREDGSFVNRSSSQLFKNKKVILFALPGAYTPTCSSTHLPGYEELYDEFVNDLDIDEIYCLSVNDAFVMNSWSKDQGIEKVKMIPDGNADFTRQMGALVSKTNLGFGSRSWRYSAFINDGVIEKLFIEPGVRDDAYDDPFEVSDADTMMNYLKSNVLVS